MDADEPVALIVEDNADMPLHLTEISKMTMILYTENGQTGLCLIGCDKKSQSALY